MEVRPINTKLLTRGPLEVRVIKVETPTFFWVHIRNARDELDELVECLTRRMARIGHKLHHRPEDVRLDEAVAVREGKRWQRGLVIRVEEGNIITVALRDWGRVIQRPMFEVFILEDRFRGLEWQAIPCGLANIEPAGRSPTWPRRVNQLFRVLIEKREGWMEIKEAYKDEAAAVGFRARLENGGMTGDLKKLLEQMGCAQHSDKAITTK